MLRQILKRSGPVIPIVYVDAHVNQSNTANLIKRIRKFGYRNAKGIALVCSVQNSMPVQVDKILQQIKRVKQQHDIPVYSFLLDECTPESYYMASCADEIYALPSTVVNLHRDEARVSFEKLLSVGGLAQFVVKSSENLSGVTLDKFTSSNTTHLGNRKDSHVSEVVYAEARHQRLERIRKSSLQRLTQIKSLMPTTLPDVVIGREAVNVGLVDGIGEHYRVLSEKHPGCEFEVINKSFWNPRAIKRILIILFIFKVILKYTIILYLFLRSRGSVEQKQATETKGN